MRITMQEAAGHGFEGPTGPGFVRHGTVFGPFGSRNEAREFYAGLATVPTAEPPYWKAGGVLPESDIVDVMRVEWSPAPQGPLTEHEATTVEAMAASGEADFEFMSQYAGTITRIAACVAARIGRVVSIEEWDGWRVVARPDGKIQNRRGAVVA